MIEITTWFTIGAVGMLVGTAAFLRRWLSAGDDDRRYYATLSAISLIAAVAYALMALEVGWITVDERVVFAPRYVDWILTTPLLLAFLGWLAGVERETLLQVVGVNTVVMVAGFVAAILSGVERYALFAVGGIAYVVLVYLVLGPMTARAAERDDGTESLFNSLRNLTIILWSVYPIIWLLGPPGLALLTPGVDVMLITYLDLLTKVGFGLIALNASTVIEAEYETAGIDAGAKQPA
ncbi:sensory rhodopsin-2 [Salinadaptatus halalkaliphilus]|uniref:Sensory rhodopsin-2 n=1 Tax=Salinadaptatus halalkaliphilus TaxID=2419781 RepID=A0A4S3TIS5_9EURY|nr:bacteriorhodopsin [Salinadaptatus halalkaliphilus]THE63866.1 sensory rhodopsin-2 [Salinadaptatus halalkaliphilus]